MDEKENEVEQAESELPAPKPTLVALLNWLHERLSETECDNTLRLTMEFARLHGIGQQRLREWAERYHGFCDCEIIWNLPDTNPAFRDFK